MSHAGNSYTITSGGNKLTMYHDGSFIMMYGWIGDPRGCITGKITENSRVSLREFAFHRKDYVGLEWDNGETILIEKAGDATFTVSVFVGGGETHDIYGVEKDDIYRLASVMVA